VTAASAGAGGDDAQVKGDMWLLKWTVGVVVALILGLFWMQWQMVDRMGGIEGRLTTVEGRLTSVEGQLTNVQEQIPEVGGRLTTIETKLTPPS